MKSTSALRGSSLPGKHGTPKGVWDPAITDSGSSNGARVLTVGILLDGEIRAHLSLLVLSSAARLWEAKDAPTTTTWWDS